MITRYGYDVFFVVTALCVVLFFIAISFIEPRVLKYLLICISIVLFGFTVYFFRDPERKPPTQTNGIVAPADGKVIAVKTAFEGELFRDNATLISIFMSPLNVHVNRIPLSGKVVYTRYVEGEYFAAFEDKASEKNEQMIVGIEGSNGIILMKQIAGFIARRIVCELKVGDTVEVGERFGMIKFGSRVDIYLPLNAQVRVSVGTKTRAGETILAEIPTQ